MATGRRNRAAGGSAAAAESKPAARTRQARMLALLGRLQGCQLFTHDCDGLVEDRVFRWGFVEFLADRLMMPPIAPGWELRSVLLYETIRLELRQVGVP